MFLGQLLDSERQLVCVPKEKVDRALELIDYFLNKDHRKVMVQQLQQLCGFLNFLCRCVVPGRAFTMRLYVPLTGLGKKIKPHHHIHITQENRLDLVVWKRFLKLPEVFCRPFIDALELPANEIFMYSDASGKLGLGAICENSWLFGRWPQEFLEHNPTIEYQELFALVAGVLQWLHRFKNKRIRLFCDNQAVASMVNNNSSLQGMHDFDQTASVGKSQEKC